ncbi:MAG TPA: hypothetical protein VKB65_05920, partial [Myxococcota bacterium]|nr:hypothetical protein [Myxococcota bacterium]
MGSLSDLATWRAIFVQAAEQLANGIVAFLPNLVGAAVILAVGWVVSRAVEAVTVRGLRGLGFDRAATRLRVGEVLSQAGVRLAASELVAKAVFWVLFLTFLWSSAATLGLSAVSATLDRLVAYLPDVMAALLILMVGVLLARPVGSVVGSTAAAAGFPSARRLGFGAQALIVALVVIAALERLGVATDVLVVPLTAVATAVTLSAGLAFALGARPVMTHILAG